MTKEELKKIWKEHKKEIIFGGVLAVVGLATAKNSLDVHFIKNVNKHNAQLVDLNTKTMNAQLTLNETNHHAFVEKLNYIADQIPQVTAKILEAFGVSQENAISESVGKDALNLTKLAKDNVKNLAKAVINPEGATKSN